jgi:hypothetical protein
MHMPDQQQFVPIAPRRVSLSSPLKTGPHVASSTRRTGVVVSPRTVTSPNVPLDFPGGNNGPASETLGRDSRFPPVVPGPINMTNGGGVTASGAPVQVIFWGSAWDQPSTSPSSGSLNFAIQQLLAGPYLTALRQYGITRNPFGGSVLVNTPEPPNTFVETDINSLVSALIENGTFPEPDEGGRNIYLVMMPPNTSYGPGGARGAHSSFASGSAIDTDTAWAGWIGNDTTKNAFDRIMETFSHELVEMCTDPEGDAWTVLGQPESEDEIGDVCAGLHDEVNGVTAQSYWSAFDNVCILPTAYSVRRTFGWAGVKLNGKGLRSIVQGSLRALIQNL